MNMDGTVTGTSAVDYAQLARGVTYYYYVMAYGADGTSESFESGKPAAVRYGITVPKISKITNVKGKKAKLTWKKTANTVSYRIYRSTSKTKGFQLIKTVKTLSYTDTKLMKGKSYYYKIIAIGTNELKADFQTSSSAVKSIKIKK